MSTDDLSVLSLNCWGLYVVAKKRKFRLQAIGDYLSKKDYDIIALQEVWMQEDFEYIKEKTSEKLPFSKYFYSGSLGSGLVLLSKFPILSCSFLKFHLAGRPLKVLQGDFYVGKGCGSVCIEHPTIGLIDVYTTHLQAGYGNHDDYEAQRITECWQIANCVRSSAAQGRQIILTGDFNSIPTSNCYQILKNHGYMTDSWLKVNQEKLTENSDSFNSNQLSAWQCIQLYGITCDSPLNTWTKHLLKQHPYEKNFGDRLDYVFYRHTPELKCQKSSVVMETYIPNTEYSFSDHYGVESIFKLTPKVDNQQLQLIRPDETLLLPETVYTIISLIEQELVKAQKTSTFYLALCIACLFIIVALYIIQILFNHLDAIFGLLLILFTCISTISLFVGFIFGNMEQRTYKQFLIEIKCLIK